MWQLLIFMIKWLVVGKPKEKRDVVNASDEVKIVEEKIKDILGDKKWLVYKTEIIQSRNHKIGHEQSFVIFYSKERY